MASLDEGEVGQWHFGKRRPSGAGAASDFHLAGQPIESLGCSPYETPPTNSVWKSVTWLGFCRP